MRLETSSDIAQIWNLLSDEDKYIKAITALVYFGIFKFIIWPYVGKFLEWRKSWRDEKDEKEKNEWYAKNPNAHTTTKRCGLRKPTEHI